MRDYVLDVARSMSLRQEQCNNVFGWSSGIHGRSETVMNSEQAFDVVAAALL